ncbi:uncharacterized protein TM35_000034500 [Trypanosoma theileri]|uniref:Uncharacterized protein n=1 Tax=Trypanosoma theileri TaxID=67003 RepID=A0A1X0P6Y1_9TRYP|nr:uncharacterized protein TM35_000034500 [Trypanosoma theileri]ORC92697.1 hypothetical protein TM35_000034500 [Trypanosoma theileri]
MVIREYRMNPSRQSNPSGTNRGNGLSNSNTDSNFALVANTGVAIGGISRGVLPSMDVEQFQMFLRDVALRGDIAFPDIPQHQHESFFAMAATCSQACRVVVDPNGTLHLRSGPANPYLREQIARELHRLHMEGVKTSRDDPPILEWGFIDRTVHREVVTLLQLLAFDMGIFIGQPLFDGTYLYRIEVALHYFPRWEEERRKLIDPALQGDADPFPIPLTTLRNPRVMDVYRREIRPFLYERNCKVTRCLVNILRDSGGKIPGDARTLGSSFSLRHEVNVNGQVFFRRWTRHLVQVFLKYAEELKRQDRRGVEAIMKSYGNDIDPVDAEVMTPHFGFFNYCLEERYFRKDMAELEDLSRRAGYFVRVSIEDNFAVVAATARQNPELSDEYKTVFSGYAGAGENKVARVAYSRDTQQQQQQQQYHHHREPQKLQIQEGIHAQHRYINEGILQAGPGRSYSRSDSSGSDSGSSGSSDNASDSSDNSQRGRRMGSGIKELDENDIRVIRVIQAEEGRTTLPTLNVSGFAVEPRRESPRVYSLAASTLYDTIVGRLQRTLPPGWNVRCGPGGGRYFLDHIRGRAYPRDSSAVSMEWAANQRELYNVADSMQ